MQKQQIVAALPASQIPGIVIQVNVSFQRMNHDRMCKELGDLVATGRLDFLDPRSEGCLDRARHARFGDKPQPVEFIPGKEYDREKVAGVLLEFNLKFEIVDFGEPVESAGEELATSASS